MPSLRTTIFSLIGAAAFYRQAFVVPDPSLILVMASMFLMGAVPIDMLERALKASISVTTAPPAEDKTDAP